MAKGSYMVGLQELLEVAGQICGILGLFLSCVGLFFAKKIDSRVSSIEVNIKKESNNVIRIELIALSKCDTDRYFVRQFQYRVDRHCNRQAQAPRKPLKYKGLSFITKRS
jgi:hypothetical protein